MRGWLRALSCFERLLAKKSYNYNPLESGFSRFTLRAFAVNSSNPLELGPKGYPSVIVISYEASFFGGGNTQ